MSSSGQFSVTTDCADNAHGEMAATPKRQRHVRHHRGIQGAGLVSSLLHATTNRDEDSVAHRPTRRSMERSPSLYRCAQALNISEPTCPRWLGTGEYVAVDQSPE